MGLYDKFGEVLNRHLQREGRNPSWLASKVDVVPSTVTRWRNGETRPDSPERVHAIADALSVFNRKERQAMFVAAGYGYAEDGEGVKMPSEIPAQFAELLDIVNAFRIFIGNWLRHWELDGSKPERWELRLFAFVQKLGGKLTPRGFLLFLLIVGMWWLTQWLVGPILEWPLANKEQQLAASVRFGIATLLIPLLVALLTRVEVDNQGVSGRSETLALLQLKVAGALVGFYVLSFVIVAIALMLFYLRSAGISGRMSWLMVGLPLLSCYVCAYVITRKRYQMFGRFKLHPVDHLVLVAFLVVGPVTAAFLFLERDMLQNQHFGVILFVLLVGYVLWAYKQQHPNSVSGYLVILVWGVVLPCVILFAPLWMTGEKSLNANLYDVALFAVYIVGQGVLVATIYVRGQAKIFWPFLLWFIALELTALLALLQNLRVGVIFMGILVLLFGAIWILSKTVLRKYLDIHNSFWVMQLVFVLSLSAWGVGLLPSWMVAILYILATAPLVYWASKSGELSFEKFDP